MIAKILSEARGMLTVETAIFSTMVGGAAFANAVLFPDHRDIAFAIGSLLGSTAFLSWNKPSKLKGWGLMMAAIIWVITMVDETY